MDNRFNKLLLYLEKQKISTKNLVAIKSDASFRKYYRLENNILAMDAAPEKGESVSKFSEIARILHSFNLSAPKIIDVNNKEGFILLEDFGDKVFSKHMNKENKKNLYKKAIDVRSEHEFKKGTIPNSISMPILNDDQHKLVGIEYKKNGKESAIDLGLKLVSGEKKQKIIDDWISIIKKHNIEYIFCKRGGLRSKTAKKWLREKNIDIKVYLVSQK